MRRLASGLVSGVLLVAVMAAPAAAVEEEVLYGGACQKCAGPGGGGAGGMVTNRPDYVPRAQGGGGAAPQGKGWLGRIGEAVKAVGNAMLGWGVSKAADKATTPTPTSASPPPQPYAVNGPSCWFAGAAPTC